jgi:hypothetical protein
MMLQEVEEEEARTRSARNGASTSGDEENLDEPVNKESMDSDDPGPASQVEGGDDTDEEKASEDGEDIKLDFQCKNTTICNVAYDEIQFFDQQMMVRVQMKATDRTMAGQMMSTYVRASYLFEFANTCIRWLLKNMLCQLQGVKGVHLSSQLLRFPRSQRMILVQNLFVLPKLVVLG